MTALIIDDNSIAKAIIEKLTYEMEHLKIGKPTPDAQNKDTVFVYVTSGTGEHKPAAFPLSKAAEVMDINVAPVPVNDGFVFFRDNSIIRRLNTDEILYIEAMGDYVKIHTAKKTYVVHCTMKATEQKLSASNFIKVHRSFIVALNKLDSIQDGGLVIRDRFIPVADNFRRTLNQRVNML